MTLQTLFPTLLRHAEIGDEPLRTSLEKVCWVLEDEDEAGNDWCDQEGYDGYTSYAFLDAEAANFARDLHWDMQDQTLELNGLWVNILGESGSHSGHIHPGSVISGTYYVSLPEGAGQLKFEDPRLGFMMAAPQPLDDAPESARRFVYATPKQGHAMFWESWLRHEVMPNRSETPRLSISFNYALKRS